MRRVSIITNMPLPEWGLPRGTVGRWCLRGHQSIPEADKNTRPTHPTQNLCQFPRIRPVWVQCTPPEALVAWNTVKEGWKFISRG